MAFDTQSNTKLLTYLLHAVFPILHRHCRYILSVGPLTQKEWRMSIYSNNYSIALCTQSVGPLTQKQLGLSLQQKWQYSLGAQKEYGNNDYSIVYIERVALSLKRNMEMSI